MQVGAPRRGTNRRPALVLDGRLRQSLLTVRALGRAGVDVFVAESEVPVPAFASRWCAGRAAVPDFRQDSEAFVDRVLALCEEIGDPVVVASGDGAIQALRSRRSEVERVGSLALSSENAMSVAIDKPATLTIAQRLGIDVPPGKVVADMSMSVAAIDEVGLPLVVKPVVSWVSNGRGGWRGSPTIASTADAALAAVKLFLDGGVAVLVQRWLCGARDAVGMFLADDVVWAKFAVRSHRMRPMTGGSSIVRETIPMSPDLGTSAEALIRELALDGYAEVEFRRDGDGRPFLMEVNPRLNAGVEVAVRAGVNVPLLLYRWVAGETLRPALAYRPGTRMRWLSGDLGWLADALVHPEHPDAPGRVVAVGTFVRDFARPAGYDYWIRGDLRPAMLEVAHGARVLPGKVGAYFARALASLRRRLAAYRR